MKNSVKRLILFAVALPVLTAVIFFLPHYGHLSVIVLLVFIGLFCGMELRSMLARVLHPMPSWTVLIPALSPILAWTVNMGWLPSTASTAAMVVALTWALGGSIFIRESETTEGLLRMGSRILMVVYPAWSLWWVANLTWFHDSSLVLFIFMITVFLNDSAAWFFGILLGKRRNIFAVSPVKSLEGFIGGILVTIVIIMLAGRVLPAVLPHPPWQLAVFGLVCGVIIILGDLVESTLKRAVGVKDSGRLIPGRGGMLDSVDSVLLTAPVFVLFLRMGGL